MKKKLENMEIINTAYFTACGRAKEQELSGDLFAELWLDQKIKKSYDLYLKNVSIWESKLISIRFKYFLENIKQFLGDEGTLVNVGSGLSSYSYMISKKIKSLELDSPKQIALKNNHLLTIQNKLPSSAITQIPFDLTSLQNKEDFIQLIEPHVKKKERIFFLLEGILYYLPEKILKFIFEAINEFEASKIKIGCVYWSHEIKKNALFAKYIKYLSLENKITFIETEEIKKYLSNFKVEESPNLIDLGLKYNLSPMYKFLNEILYENFILLVKKNSSIFNIYNVKKISKVLLDNNNPVIKKILNLQKNLIAKNNLDHYKTGFLVSSFQIQELINLIHRGSLYYIEEKDKIIGYAIVTPLNDFFKLCTNNKSDHLINHSPLELINASLFCYLYQIAVDKDSQYKGVGTSLIKYIKENAGKNILTDILIKPIKNKASLNFFAKNNFKQYGNLFVNNYRDFGKLISKVLIWKQKNT
jgi:O-methyltransferase involved in polyketide biosynthesis/GNAT superfamily N-acetyltransferase